MCHPPELTKGNSNFPPIMFHGMHADCCLLNLIQIGHALDFADFYHSQFREFKAGFRTTPRATKTVGVQCQS